MQKQILYADLEIIRKGLGELGIQVSTKAGESSQGCETCYYINNPDGTLRWLWPSSSKRPGILKFYHVGSTAALIKYTLIKLCFMLGLTRFISSGKCKMYFSSVKVNPENWALFTGTVGENRKLVVWTCFREREYFIKCPLNDVSAANIVREYHAIQQVEHANIIQPHAMLKGKALILSNTFTGSGKRVNAIKDIPAEAMKTWILYNLKHSTLESTEWWNTINARISEQQTDSRMPALLTNRLNKLVNCFETKEPFAFSYSHGDFTAWNMQVQDNKPALIDWEFAADNKPALYDLFHFIYQNEILVKHSSYRAIRNEIDRCVALPHIKDLLIGYDIDPIQAEQMYLADTISYYIYKYSKQCQWHTQVNWLLQIWTEALGYWLEYRSVRNAREVVLEDMVYHLQNVPYAILKLDVDDITMLPAGSDIDMCINCKDTCKLVKYLSNHTNVLQVRVTRKSFMKRITAILTDNSFLHIDCIQKLKRKNLVFANAQDFINSAELSRGNYKKVSTSDNYLYVLLFHLLNKANVPAKYVQAFTKLNAKEKVIADTFISKTLGIDYPVENAFQYNKVRFDQIRKQLGSQPANKLWQSLSNTIQYLYDCFLELLPKQGFMVTFSGVDGAGKTTVISTLRNKIEKELRVPVVVLRHRPSVLPIISAWKYGKTAAEERSVQSLPRTGANKSLISSYLRFAYYFTDYLLGQFYIQIRYVWRGYVVLYDRYYFDFINDSKRSNIVIPEKLARKLYALLIKPDINYFLYAGVEIVRARKQELDENSIRLLTKKYLHLFENLKAGSKNSSYESIENIELGKTLNTIFGNIKTQSICASL